MKRAVLVGLTTLSVVGMAAILVYAYLNHRVTEFSQTPFGPSATKTIEIPTGTGPRRLSELLAKEHLVSDGEWLYWYLKREQLGPRLKAGEYEFQMPMTPATIIDTIISGRVKVYKFTVREGLRVDETLPILAQSDLKLDLRKLEELSQSSSFLQKLNLPSQSLEGFLFPDTYTFSRGATEEMVLNKMVKRAREELQTAQQQAGPGIQLNPLEALTLASIIEKETGATEERPRISCVFHNRLRKNMRLQTDPTVLYAMMLRRGGFVKNITRSDLTTDHPYNTYTRYGLPPGPIASPGAAAMAAAFNPINCDDLFFVSRNDGTHIFCPDLKCHEAAVKRWQIEYFRNKGAQRSSTR